MSCTSIPKRIVSALSTSSKASTSSGAVGVRCMRLAVLNLSHSLQRTSVLTKAGTRTLSTLSSSQPSVVSAAAVTSFMPGSMHNRYSNSVISHSSRGFRHSAVAHHNDIVRPEPGTGFKVHFQDSKGTLLKTIEANEGDSILDLAHEHDIDLEGACEGSIACSTCHVILEPEMYDLLPEPEDEENDMLDMAFGLTDTSRLGCQVFIKRELDGLTVTLPSATRNMFVDGVKPTKH